MYKISKLIPEESYKYQTEDHIEELAGRKTGETTGIILSLISAAMLEPGVGIIREEGTAERASELRKEILRWLNKMELLHFQVTLSNQSRVNVKYNIFNMVGPKTIWEAVDAICPF